MLRSFPESVWTQQFGFLLDENFDLSWIGLSDQYLQLVFDVKISAIVLLTKTLQWISLQW